MLELVAQRFFWFPSALILLWILIQIRARSSRSGRLPPGPTPLPIIGNLLAVGDKPHRSLAHLAKIYGPLMTVKLGQVTTLVISSAEMACEVLQKRDQAFCGRYVPDSARFFGHHEASMAFHSVDQHWRNLRKIYNTHLFMSQKISNNRGLREEKVRELTMYVRDCCKVGKPVDIGRAALATVMNIISNTVFSIDIVDPRSESPQYFMDIMRTIVEKGGAPNLSDFFPMLRFIDIQGRRRGLASLTGKLFAIFDEVIDRRMQIKSEQVSDATTTNDFLDSLIHYHLADDSIKINRGVMRSVLLEMFLAGGDTISSTVEWAMAELLHNPSSMEKVHAELFSTINVEKEVGESDIKQLPYLQAVVKETLRLHPPTPFLLPRKAETNVELYGYIIPKGTQVLVNAWAIGRDEKVWMNPDLFMPERFLENDIDYKGQDFELIPFGAGRRICPGLPLAFQMVHLVLASLMHSFNWKLLDAMEPMDVDMSDKFRLTLAKAIPVHAIPTSIK